VANRQQRTQAEAEAWRLRVAGASFPQIAREMGCSVSTAFERVSRHEARIPEESTRSIRKRMLEALDYWERQVRSVAIADHYVVSNSGKIVLGPDGNPLRDHAAVLAAVNSGLKVLAERAKLLGLHVTTKDGQFTEEEVDRWIGKLRADIERFERDGVELPDA
jgi:hypothetical protein